MAIRGGNRRAGSARGTKGRRGTLGWRDDTAVLERVELVTELYDQPTSVIHQAVNKWLEERGLPPVSEQTIYLDRRRAVEVLAERIATNMQGHKVNLQRMVESAWRDVNRTKAGPGRAPLYTVIFRGIVAQAQLDGSWRAPQTPAAGPPVIDGELVSSQELLDAGRISPDEYRHHLVVFHAMTGGLDTRVVKDVTPAEPRALPAPAPRVTTGGGSAGRVSSVAEIEDEIEPGAEDAGAEVVDWSPDE